MPIRDHRQLPEHSISFGPVHSQRLGMSLGINNIPAKRCTYSCIYCQVGTTLQPEYGRRAYYPPEDIFEDVRNRVEKAKELPVQIDYLTFVPSGEPTLDINLGREIALLKALKIPIAVITNASLLSRVDVREELFDVDVISLKIDTVQESLWRKMNRPVPSLGLAKIQDGIRAFKDKFFGRLITETLLIQGFNDSENSIEQTAIFLSLLQPFEAFLSSPFRPPAEKWVHGPREEILNRAYETFSRRIRRVKILTRAENEHFVSTGAAQQDLLAITSVHPMREDDVSAFLSRTGSSWRDVEQLLEQGELLKIEHEGQTFFLKRQKK